MPYFFPSPRYNVPVNSETPFTRNGLLWALLAASLVLICYLSAVRERLDQFDGNYSGFLHLRPRFFERNPLARNTPGLQQNLIVFEEGGHDQVFYFSMAFDPFLLAFPNARQYKQLVDNPPVRYTRIGYPLLIKLFSMDHPERYAKTMVYLMMGSILIGSFFLALIFLMHNRNALWAISYLLIPGFWLSVSRVLPEPICAAFLLAGLFFYLRRARWACACCLAVAILIRETAALAVLILCLYELLVNQDRKTALILCFALLPMAGWKLYLTWRLFPGYGWATILPQPVLTLPYGGFIELFKRITEGTHRQTRMTAAIYLCIMFTSLLAFSTLLLSRRRTAFALQMFVFVLLSLSLNVRVWSSVGNVERTTFEGFLFSLLTFAASQAPQLRMHLLFFALMASMFIYDVWFLTAREFFRSGILLQGFI